MNINASYSGAPKFPLFKIFSKKRELLLTDAHDNSRQSPLKIIGEVVKTPKRGLFDRNKVILRVNFTGARQPQYIKVNKTALEKGLDLKKGTFNEVIKKNKGDDTLIATQLVSHVISEKHHTYLKGVKQYYRDAINPLKTPKQTIIELKEATKLGSAEAALRLGKYYDPHHNLSLKGVTKNEAKARKHYETAAKLGSLEALMQLGRLAKDPKIKAGWFKIATNRGNYEGMKSMAAFYIRGIGVKKNLQQAHSLAKRYLDKFPNDGYVNKLMGQIYLEQGNRSEALSYFERAADSGENCYQQIGDIYLSFALQKIKEGNSEELSDHQALREAFISEDLEIKNSYLEAKRAYGKMPPSEEKDLIAIKFMEAALPSVTSEEQTRLWKLEMESHLGKIMNLPAEQYPELVKTAKQIYARMGF